MKMTTSRNTMRSASIRRSGPLLIFAIATSAALTLCAPSLAAAVQEHQEPQDQEGEAPPRKLDTGDVLAPPGSGQSDPMQRIKELFREVEGKLYGIDLLLTDAAAGDTSRLKEVEDPGIDRLLRESLERGREVQRDIEEILEIAKELGSQQPSSSGSSSGGKPQEGQEGQPGGSPLDRGPQTQSSEQTPSMPEEKPGGEEPGEKDPEQDPQQDGSDGEPKGSKDPKDPNRENRSGDDPPGAQQGEGAPRVPSDDGWGNLPRHVRDTFRTEGRGDMPARYRDWIDSYYRKLNRRSSSRR